MKANDLMLEKIAEVIYEAGKYVFLNFTGNALTTIPGIRFDGGPFSRCITLAGITIPDSVTELGIRNEEVGIRLKAKQEAYS
jgi:hypothetical protein